MWFYTEIVNKVEKLKTKNNLGQVTTNYSKGKQFNADIQPITEKAMLRTWGRELESTLEMYADVTLKVDDIVVYNNKCYQIEARVNWSDYSIYALKEVDIVVN